METINWKDRGSSVDIVKSVNAERHFTVVVEGALAKAFGAHFGTRAIGLTPVEVSAILGLTVIVAIGSLTLYALSKGYRVTGKARTPDGTEYEICFEPT
ncbi:hypothetical protein [Crenobacter caeni]|uniref:Uncharacterized protein n=1 Tax=Crenobacter caeni TaxID=2705474 RepID=A0A6B2KVU8_9NEIS|nr:hypothetical protein [Crenobacter caeni]NDV14224.1 hypothetical protein [Crenobacter caeni]